MKAQREIKKDPKSAVEMIEKVLEEEPYNRQANLVLKEAAVAAGWPEIGVFALRTLLEENPTDVKLLNELGRLYHDDGTERRRSRSLQSHYRNRSAERRSFASRKGCFRPRIDDAPAAGRRPKAIAI